LQLSIVPKQLFERLKIIEILQSFIGVDYIDDSIAILTG